MKDKYGEDVLNSSSESSSSEEDEDAEALTSDVERDFFRTLSLLKSKDPSIYDSQTQFFGMTRNYDYPLPVFFMTTPFTGKTLYQFFHDYLLQGLNPVLQIPNRSPQN